MQAWEVNYENSKDLARCQERIADLQSKNEKLREVLMYFAYPGVFTDKPSILELVERARAVLEECA